MSNAQHDNDMHEDDVHIESDTDTNTDGFGRTGKEHKLRAKLKDAETKAADHLAGWQRAKADLINFKKETTDKQGQMVARATAGLVAEVLPVLDSFSMAMSNEEVWNAVDENWRRGMEHTHTQLLKVLTEHGLSEISPSVDEEFNPHDHEPVGDEQAESEAEDGTIAKLVQKGYRLNDRVIRPARVIVRTFTT